MNVHLAQLSEEQVIHSGTFCKLLPLLFYGLLNDS